MVRKMMTTSMRTTMSRCIENVIDPRNREPRVERAAATAADLGQAGDARPRRMALEVIRDEVLVEHVRGQHAGHVRRGPTSDMSPLITLMSWGISSRLVLRRNAADPGDARIARHRLPRARRIAARGVHRAEFCRSGTDGCESRSAAAGRTPARAMSPLIAMAIATNSGAKNKRARLAATNIEGPFGERRCRLGAWLHP